MRKSVIGGGVAIALASIAAAGPAGAQSTPTYGSASIMTSRPCIATASGDCQLGTRNFVQYAGGAGSSFSTSATNEANGGASGSAYSSFSGNAVPTLGVAAFAGPNTRTGTSAMAYQTYTYTGNAAINLAFAGTLHYLGSGTLAPTGITGVDPGGTASFNVNFSVVSTSLVPAFGTTAQELVSNDATFTDCSSGAIASVFASSAGIGAGEHSIGVSLNTTCGGGAITINPGQSFVVLETTQAIANKSGYLDASHTFSAIFDPNNTVFASTGQSVGAAFLAQAVVALPEPSAWSMMILGFGLGGLRLRRARRRLVLAGA